MENNLYTQKNIALLLLGRTVSKFGAAFYLIALPLYILQLTGSLAQTGVFFSLSSIPALTVTPFMGVFVEKVNRKHLIVVCDFLTAILYALLLFPLDTKPFMAVLFGVTVFINVLSHMFEIGSKVMFTELTTPETIEKYNGIKSFADNAAAVIAPAMGTVAFGLLGFRFVVLVVTACYALSAVQECFILYRKVESTPNQERKNWLLEFGDGLRYVAKQKDVLALFIMVMALNFFVANGEEIINPGIIVRKYSISESLFGMTSSAAVVGTLAAGFFIFKNKKIDLQKNMKNLLLLNSILMVMIGIGSLCMTAVPMAYFSLFLVFELLLGFVTSCVNVPLLSSLQTHVPINYQGRFFSLLSFSSGLLIPMGITYTGFLASLVGADVAYIVNNVCVIFIVLLCGTFIS
ncbi:MAG: MFS transporter [Lachnospiraceae bacterium]|nr:MFS transporter [Lachnospiraceae bacterium]